MRKLFVKGNLKEKSKNSEKRGVGPSEEVAKEFIKKTPKDKKSLFTKKK